MLRENLDTVLKDLLEFKDNEQINSIYPGPSLDLENNLFTEIVTNEEPKPLIDFKKVFFDAIPSNSQELSTNTAVKEYAHDIHVKKYYRSDILNRIRRYLDRKSIAILKPISKVKHKVHKYFTKNNKHQIDTGQRLKRNTLDRYRNRPKKFKRKFFIKTKQIRVGRKLQMYSKASRIQYKRKEREADADAMADALNKMLRETDEDPITGDATLKARFLFKSCMNYEILEKRGHQPLLDLLDLFGGWPIINQAWDGSNFDWLELMAKLRLYNNDILISEWVGPDIKNSDEFVIQFDQTSLGKYLILAVILTIHNKN